MERVILPPLVRYVVIELITTSYIANDLKKVYNIQINLIQKEHIYING